MTLLLTILLLFAALPAEAAILIQDGFEYPDMATLSSTGGWDFICGSTSYAGQNPPGNATSGPCSMDLSTVAHSGSKSLRYYYGEIHCTDPTNINTCDDSRNS